MRAILPAASVEYLLFYISRNKGLLPSARPYLTPILFMQESNQSVYQDID
jgi:hypothetical protein